MYVLIFECVILYWCERAVDVVAGSVLSPTRHHSRYRVHNKSLYESTDLLSIL